MWPRSRVNACSVVTAATLEEASSERIVGEKQSMFSCSVSKGMSKINASLTLATVFSRKGMLKVKAKVKVVKEGRTKEEKKRS